MDRKPLKFVIKSTVGGCLLVGKVDFDYLRKFVAEEISPAILFSRDAGDRKDLLTMETVARLEPYFTACEEIEKLFLGDLSAATRGFVEVVSESRLVLLPDIDQFPIVHKWIARAVNEQHELGQLDKDGVLTLIDPLVRVATITEDSNAASEVALKKGYVS